MIPSLPISLLLSADMLPSSKKGCSHELDHLHTIWSNLPASPRHCSNKSVTFSCGNQRGFSPLVTTQPISSAPPVFTLLPNASPACPVVSSCLALWGYVTDRLLLTTSLPCHCSSVWPYCSCENSPSPTGWIGGDQNSLPLKVQVNYTTNERRGLNFNHLGNNHVQVIYHWKILTNY